MGKWCTVTVTDGEGRRYSLDVNAESSYHAAHLYLTHVCTNPGCGFPIPTTSTLFEVSREGRILRVHGARLKRWIENRRHEWKGPCGRPSVAKAIEMIAELLQLRAAVFPRSYPVMPR